MHYEIEISQLITVLIGYHHGNHMSTYIYFSTIVERHSAEMCHVGPAHVNTVVYHVDHKLCSTKHRYQQIIK